MEGNREEQKSKKDNAYPRTAQKIRKNSTEPQAAICDSDSCECQCEDKHISVKEGSRRKSRGGSNPTKAQNGLKSHVKARKTLTVPCSSSEACEYDKENGEDDEDEEGETSQREHPELSSLLHDLCNSKFGTSSNESRLKSQQKSQRDARTPRQSQKSSSTDRAEKIQTMQSTTCEAETSSQTCNFLPGLHYAIPFLSDRLRSSLFSRLRCQSEPKDMGAASQHNSTTHDNDSRTENEPQYHSDSCSSNGGGPQLEGNPCQNDNHIHETQPFCRIYNESGFNSQTLIRSLPSQLEQNSCSSHFRNRSCSLHSNCFTSSHGNGGTMTPCDNEGLCPHHGQDSCHFDVGGTLEILEDHHSTPHSEDDIFGGQLSSSMSDEEIEESIDRLVEEVGRIGALEQILGVEEEISSQGSEIVPDLFSCSSDSCQADDEFECDCGHCEGSRPGHHDNNLDWQIAERLDSDGRGISSDQTRSHVESSHDSTPVGAEFDDDDIEEGVFNISLLPPLDSDQLETMFEAMIAQLQGINPSEQAQPPASSSTIENLPYSTVTAQQIDDLAPCSICLSSFVAMDTSSHLPCNHLFHLHCIQAWLAKSATCPVCRSCVEQSQSDP